MTEYKAIGPDGKLKMTYASKECLPTPAERKHMESIGYKFEKREVKP